MKELTPETFKETPAMSSAPELTLARNKGTYLNYKAAGLLNLTHRCRVIFLHDEPTNKWYVIRSNDNNKGFLIIQNTKNFVIRDVSLTDHLIIALNGVIDKSYYFYDLKNTAIRHNNEALDALEVYIHTN